MRVIPARATVAEPTSIEEAANFIANHHRQGLAAIGKNPRAYELRFNNELIAVALFCNPRTSGMQKRYTTELFRMAFKTDVRVQGGASKLIKAFLATNPWDLFTYQDTSGESTDVYAHAGLKLIQEAKTKQVLVKNGLTRKTAKDNHCDWLSLEQAVRFGPDRLIGTNLGEVFRKDGSRKSNIDLFIEDCEYHLEDTPGDRIYEWRNPNVSFYVYQITHKVTGEYYIGRKSINLANATIEDCLIDGYMGSGGIEYKKWRDENLEHLSKEIITLCNTWEDVIRLEKEAIGSKNLDDPLCLNLLPGGVGNTKMSFRDIQRNCEIHGITLHRGKSCLRCAASRGFATITCSTHGEVIGRGGACLICSAERRITLNECSQHGVTKFQDGVCSKCRSESIESLRECSIHGLVKHRGDSCFTCASQKSITLKTCFIHGETKHQAEVCVKCENTKRTSIKSCEIHGETSFRGDKCYQCFIGNAVSLKECPIHGQVKHQSNTCTKCVASKAFNDHECAIHGMTKHQGSNCMKCHTAKNFTLKECSIHGLVKFRGNSCGRCSAEKRAVTMAEKRKGNLS